MNDWQQSENEVIFKVAGIIVRNRKLLLTRTRGTDLFLSPGGKPLAGEDPEEALRRELAEETGLVTIQADYFGRFEGISAFEPTRKIVMDAYQVIVGGDPFPGREISELIWVGADHLKIGIGVGSVFRDSVIPALLERGLIDCDSFDSSFSKSANLDAPVFTIVDLDGSIIFRNEPLDPRIAAAIEATRRSRAKVMFATSRAPRGVTHILPEALWEVPTIYCNGALIKSGKNELSRVPIETAVSREICDHLLTKGISFHLEYGETFSLFGRKEQFPHLLSYDRYEVNPTIQESTFDGILKIALPEREVVYRMLRSKRHLLPHLHTLSHSSGFVELVAAGVDKLSAVKSLVNDRYAYVIAFVNDYNDFGLLTGCSSAVVIGHRLWSARYLCRTMFIRPNVDEISGAFFRIASRF